MPIHARIATILYAVVGGFALVVSDLRYLFLPTACVSVALFLAGFAYWPRFRGVFAIPWAELDSEEESQMIVIEDTPCPRRGYPQELIVMIVTRRLPELAAKAVLASVTAYVILMGKMTVPQFLVNGWGLFGLEFAALVGWNILLGNLRWFSERRFLRNAYRALAAISTKDPGFLRRGITYQFLDHENQRRGGQGPLWGHQHDNAAIIFYRPENPDRNIAHGGLVFHKLRVHLIPSRNRIGTHP